MPTLADLRAQAQQHARQIDAVRYLTVQELAVRWHTTDDAVRAIPREQLPYIAFGKSKMRRYDPRDVEAFEDTQKRGGKGHEQ